MGAKEHHIELTEREKELLNQAGKKMQEIDYNLQVAQEMKAQHQGHIQVMLELICGVHGVGYVDGIMVKEGKLIVPKNDRSSN